MASIFNALPGLDVLVGDISKSLAQMWTDTAAEGGAAPAADDAKATQVNFVLHLGFGTTAEDAAEQFQTVVRFSRMYPSRIVVLCPSTEDEDDGEAAMVDLIHKYVYTDRPREKAAPSIINGTMRLNEGAKLNVASMADQLAWFQAEDLVGKDITLDTLLDTSYVETFEA